MIVAEVCAALILAAAPAAQTSVEVVQVISKPVEREVKLPGELRPYLSVALHSKVTGFVDQVNVDRGSIVKQGQVLITLIAPEMLAQIAEGESKVRALQLQQAEVEAKLAAAQSAYEAMRSVAADAPGAVADVDLVNAQKNADAVRAQMRAVGGSVEAAQASARALRVMEAYLRISAPFAGVITERNVHPGALVGPSAGAGQLPALRLEQVSRLRLVVAAPEAVVGGIVEGARVPFTVPAFPGDDFSGVLRRIAHSVEEKTRSMAVELDVDNSDLRLAPGMYPEVIWPVHKARPSLLVPPSSVVTTTERTFVVRVKDGKAEWVNVKRGPSVGDLLEVYGALKAGDTILRRGTDEVRPGTPVTTTAPKS
jgi:membrane fusion protein (multidrug efflux system)